MKRFMKFFAPVMAIIIGAVSCSEADVEDVVADLSTSGTVLYASTGATQTKVTFTDNEGNNEIDLKWEEGDVFAIYEGEEKLGTFNCIDAKSGKFENTDVTLEYGVEYTAKYNEEIESVDTQDGDKIDNLDNACQMETTFTYSTGATIVFGHTMAVMTFKFKSDERPSYLVFDNGKESYKVTYTYIEPEGGIYTSYIMINPCEGVERTLTFSLFDSDNKAYDIRTVETSKAYEAGYRYTASVSDLDNIAWSGAGTEDDPYQITTAAQLRLLATNVNAGTDYSGEYFEMTNDIDLGGIDESGNVVEENEFTAIGYYYYNNDYYRFQGTFDGGGYEVSGLYINKSSDDEQALFGYAYSATIKNVSVSGSVTGKGFTAGVVGRMLYTKVINCYNTATISGNSAYVAGVVGYANSSSMIINCYNTGSVVNNNNNSDNNNSESNYTGGILAYLDKSTVVNCYNTGAIKSEGKYVGGIVGFVNYSSVINCYNVESVSGSEYVGGVVGQCSTTTTVTVENCYFNSDNFSRDALGEVSSETIIDNVVGYSTDVMESIRFVVMLKNGAYAYNEEETPTIKACDWEAVSGGYPAFDIDNTPSYIDLNSCTAMGSGTESDPYLILTGEQLRNLATTVNSGTNYSGKYFYMVDDIDLGGESNEFTAIGPSFACSFQGTFDGGGHEVSGLYINQSSSDNQGLFGYIYYATIKNLGVSGSVTGQKYVGGVVGYNNNSSVTNCYNAGSIEGSSDNTGGVVGYGYKSTVSNCYNTESIKGNRYVGGIVGGHETSSIINNCYNRGSINGSSSYVGGVVGINNIGGTVSYCYSTGAVSLSTTYSSIGGIAGTNFNTIEHCIYDSSVYTGSGAIGGTSSISTTVTGSATLTATMTNGSFSSTLGTDNWKEDYTTQINDGYPILIWQ